MRRVTPANQTFFTKLFCWTNRYFDFRMFLQPNQFNVEQDGLAVAKYQKICFVSTNYVNMQLIDY